MKDKTKIKIKVIGNKKFYSKPCPFGVNDSEEYPSKTRAPRIRAVGSELCKMCKSFIKIEDNTVYCE